MYQITNSIVFVIVLIYLSSIIIVGLVKNTDIRTSFQIINHAIADIFKDKNAVIYPAFVGIDEKGYAHSDVIEQEFTSLGEIFQTFFFYNFYKDANRLLYQFKVDTPLKDMEESDFIRLCNVYCEKIIHNFLHKKNPSISHVDHIVSVGIVEGILSVFVAVNETGTKENAEMTETIRKHILDKDFDLFDTIEEEWSDKDDDIRL